MIFEPSQLDTDELRTQVCIIGAGGAGITLALELGKRKLDIVLVTGGGYDQSAADRKLYQGTIAPSSPHEPLEENRHRAFGGSTKRWGGRLVPFDPIDFEQRDFVPLSGWPISYEEVARFFPQATELCEVVPDRLQQSASRDEFDLPDSLGNGAVTTTDCERWSTPTDFGVHYQHQLRSMDNVRVLIDYHAVDLRLSENQDRITGVQLASRVGRPIRVTADIVILAAGGLENARLLLASRSQAERGVGNQNDMVGRCYMSHLAGTHGFVTLTSKRKPAFYQLAKDHTGTYRRRRFRLTDQAQRDLKVMNIIGFPCRPEPRDPSHGDAVLSMLHLRDVLSHTPGIERPSWSTAARHVANCVLNNPAAWIYAARQMRLRSQRPRLPFILPYKRRAQDALFFQVEHAPNRDSRIVLSEERDEFGMPRIQPQVRFTEIDYRTVVEFYRQLDLGLRKEQIGYLDYKESELNDYLVELTTNFNSVAHQIGTTRMSTDPQQGVVDANCKVHDLENLYITGASVFPTSSHANPTLTILALTMRLVEHLAREFRTTDTQLVASSDERPLVTHATANAP